MHLSVAEARALAEGILARHGFDAEDARLITDVLIEAHLWGRPTSGLNHLPHIIEAGERRPICILREDDHSASIDGGNNPGFLVASRAMLLAIEKAKRSRLAVIGAHNSYMGGLNGYYVSLAARQGFVAMMAISSAPRVAPAGAIDPVLGTNPMAFAIPTDGEPIVLDLATASSNVGSLHRAARLGTEIPAGVAIDADGAPTTDPHRALAGAILPFGGHKGAGLSLIVQCLGILGGGAVSPQGARDFGYFFLVVDPALFQPAEVFRKRTGELAHRVRSARPGPGVDAVRVPGERSFAERGHHLEDGIELDEPLHAELQGLLKSPA